MRKVTERMSIMGKALFISDIHGNMTAVRALEKEIKKISPDVIWFLGDAVGKGPENDQTMDWVRANCTHVIKGNWDDMAVELYKEKKEKQTIDGEFWKVLGPMLTYMWDQLGEERLNWLAELPFESEILISGMWFRLVHGRPTDRLYQAYDSWEEMAQGFISKVSDRKFDAYICADSHMPYLRACGQGYAINTGSVGNSLGVPRVHGILIEGDLGSSEKTPFRTEILSIPYDNQAAADAADLYPDFPAKDKDSWKKEVLTGVYSR